MKTVSRVGRAAIAAAFGATCLAPIASAENPRLLEADQALQKALALLEAAGVDSAAPRCERSLWRAMD